jgi:hypothetical protein
MKKPVLAVIGLVAFAAALSSAAAPASALGACGPNGHRNAWGRCVWGGQNQAWCLRHRGRVAGYGPYGTRWCR